MSARLLNEIEAVVEAVVGDAIATRRPDPAAVAREAAAAVEPVVAHATNAEPWYASRVTWGAIVSLLTPVLALAGWSLDEADRDAVVTTILAVGPAIGAVVTLYGRWAATRPIGA